MCNRLPKINTDYVIDLGIGGGGTDPELVPVRRFSKAVGGHDS
jgi:hypothetical protein